MRAVKRYCLCAVAVAAFALCLSAQSNSGSSSGSGSGSSGGSAGGAPSNNSPSSTANLGDASVNSAPTSSSIPPASVGGSSSSSSSSSNPSLRNPDTSLFDTVGRDPNLRRMLSDDPVPPLSVMPVDPINEEDCGTWTQVGARSATVSTIRLQVPGKARGVYQKACGEMKKKHLDDAQRDAQRAVDQYKEYPAAWVLLGQVYYNANNLDRAQDACAQASKIDPEYVAPYLCLAAIASRQRDWDQALDLSDHALLLGPVKNAYGHYYKAEAAYQKGDLRLAEHHALDAASADVNHQMPEIALLLARIYSAMKNSEQAALSVRDYLKWAHQPADTAAVNAQLAALSLTTPAAVAVAAK